MEQVSDQINESAKFYFPAFPTRNFSNPNDVTLHLKKAVFMFQCQLPGLFQLCQQLDNLRPQILAVKEHAVWTTF